MGLNSYISFTRERSRHPAYESMEIAVENAKREADINLRRIMEQGLVDADDERRERLAERHLPTL